MTDVLLLFAAALIVIGGGGMVALTVRASRRKAAECRREAPRRLMNDLQETDDYIEQVGNALSEDDLDSLETQREKES